MRWKHSGRACSRKRRMNSSASSVITLVVRSIVFPGKANLPVGEREQPAVGDGDAMGIAAEIGQHLFGASERCIGSLTLTKTKGAMATSDGSAKAPVGAPQAPTVLNSYTPRPASQVEGIDHAVGVPTEL